MNHESEYSMQTAKLLNSYITEMAENSVSERLIFNHPLPINLTVISYVTHSEFIFKTG